MSGVEIDPEALSDSEKLTWILAQITTMNTRLDPHGQRMALLKKAATDASGVPVATSGGASGSDDDMGGEEGGGPAQGGTRHSYTTSALGGDGTALGAGRRGGSGGGSLGEPGGGGLGGQGSGSNRYCRECVDDYGAWRLKINFPTYDGEVDPLPWLNKCGTYFLGMEMAPKERVWMASLHMEGTAAEWYYALECDVGLMSWTRFSEFVNMRFGPPLRTNGMADMKELWHTGTVEPYQR
jgi:hypothetical protein